MFSNKNYLTKSGLGDFTRSFHKIMRDKNLTLLRKLILCDVISRKIKGESYYKTSAKLAEELGTYKVETIYKNFQWLEKNGYINTQPYNKDGLYDYDLREVEVIQMEQWIYTDEYLEKIKFEVSPIVKKGKDQVSNWKRGKKKTSVEPTTNLPETTLVKPVELLPELSKVKAEPEPVLETKPLQPKETAFNVHEYLTPAKLEYTKRFEKDGITKEFLCELNKEDLDNFFYMDGVLPHKTVEKDGVDLWENINGINLHYMGTGTRLTLFIRDKEGKQKDSFQLNAQAYGNYLKEQNKGFGDLTLDNFDTLRQFEKKPLTLGV